MCKESCVLGLVIKRATLLVFQKDNKKHKMDDDITIAKVFAWFVAGVFIVAALGYGIRWAFSPVDAEVRYQTDRQSSQRIQSANSEILRLKTAYVSAKDEQEKNAIAQQVCRVKVSIDEDKLDDSIKGFVVELCK
jgi:hypothetical protein